MSKFIVEFHMKSGKTIEIQNVDDYSFKYYQSGRLESFSIERSKKESPVFFKIDMEQIEAVTVYKD